MKHLFALAFAAILGSCATVSYRTAGGSQWSLSAEPDPKQMKFLIEHGF